MVEPVVDEVCQTKLEDDQLWDFSLPSLGADMESGTIVKWLVRAGDRVESGDVIARVETEKSDIDVEIWKAGEVRELLVPVGEELSVGSPMLRLSGPEGSTDRRPPGLDTVPSAGVSLAPELSTPVANTQIDRPSDSDRRAEHASRTLVRASPFARSRAAEANVNLDEVRGTGPHGAILARDLPNSVSEPAHDGATDSDRMRMAIAARMAKANTEIPHYHLEWQVDLGDTLSRLENYNLSLPVIERVLPVALFLKSVAAAAALNPDLNGFWVHDRFEPAEHVNIAVAISLRRGGLVTPALSDVNNRTLSNTMAGLKELVAGARSGSLRSSWMTGATITVTNLGDNGADLVHGVIFPPQVGLVGFGKVRTRPWVVAGEVVPRPIVTVTLSADHRATDGATGSRFLAAVANYLTNPENL